ncbi:MAG: DUF2520 domain-containing protein [Arenicella sp.]|nr:DUF2520 domain-containing protein [Arenicella sp.]
MNVDKDNSQQQIGIIGAGKVGLSFALLCHDRGLNVVVACRDFAKTKEALRSKASQLSLNDNLKEVVRGSSIIILAVADTDISDVCKQISADLDRHTIVTHFAGALDSQVLASAKKAGAQVASTHPLNTFPNLEAALAVLQNSDHNTAMFCEGEDTALNILTPFFERLGFNCHVLDTGSKVLYHAACVMACNYSTAVINASGKIAATAGIDETVFIQALMPILRATLTNIEQHGTLASLSGPIARGDVNNVSAHLSALHASELDASFIDLYSSLGQHAITMAEQNDQLDSKQVEVLKKILLGEALNRKS